MNHVETRFGSLFYLLCKKIPEDSRRYSSKAVAYTCKSDISHILDDRTLYNGMRGIETVYDTCMIGRFYIYLYMNATNYFIACRPCTMPIGYKVVTEKIFLHRYRKLERKAH